MKYISTRDSSISTDGMAAILQGLAPDGGLYVPENIPDAALNEEKLLSMNYNRLTAYIIHLLIPELPQDWLEREIEAGYGGKFDVPEKAAVQYAGGKAFLELYHGPTSAFKDMALCLLPRLLAGSASAHQLQEKIVILTATSGDTGKAALEGFADVPGTGITVFYPRDGVSAVQKMQMVTQEGANVRVCAVEGNFDDAQTGVKNALRSLQVSGVRFSSANSINIGRLAPQVSYYFFAYAQLIRDGKIRFGTPVNFAVPTGNFGDILAGWLAKKMGLPVGRLLCASNQNKVLADFLATGVYDRRREFFLTSSPSMDILVSSNLERLLYYACGQNSETVKAYMQDLGSQGVFRVSPEVLAAIRADFDGCFAEDEEAAEIIRKYWQENHYLMDTHTAVACSCAEKCFGEEFCVVLSTASPYKFAPAILQALGTEGFDGFEALDELERVTGIPAPARLKNLRSKPVLHTDCVKPEELCIFAENAAKKFL